MKKILFFTLIGLLVSTTGFSTGVIVLEGNYQGKNLYVQNSFAASGVGFCVQEVRVNGNVTTDEITSSAFEIDFRNLQLKMGDKVEVRITHKDDCKPKVLNPEVLKPKSTFEILSIGVDKDLTFKWTTKGETGKLPYIVEQFRWNKWVKVGEVEGNGTPAENSYSFKITPHSGKNQFRVKQIDYTGQPKLSKTVDFKSDVPDISFSPTKVSKEINFSSSNKPIETMFEIYDQFGNIVKRGYASNVDVSNLPKGAYYLNYDNKMGEFIKK
ncbi:MAG TPA: hypothetical protein VLB84_14430 [Bacteroidia bacterium]|nr:hypothetical protein [Bacteroidia bacterium]